MPEHKSDLPWSDMQRTWTLGGHNSATIPVDVIVQQARKRVLWLRWLMAGETIAALFGVGFVGAFLIRGSSSPLLIAIVSTLGIAALLTWITTVVQRQGIWARLAGSSDQLIASEIKNVQSSIRIWGLYRVVAWLVALGLVALAAADRMGTFNASSRLSLVTVAVCTMPLFFIEDLLIRARVRTLSKRITQLRSLSDELAGVEGS